MGGVVLGKLCFGKDAMQYGLELCLARAGLSAHAVTPETVKGCDVLLVSMFWYRDIYALELFLRKAGIRKGGKPYILAGGMQATMTPEIIGRMVDVVFVGDADDILGELVEQIATAGQCEHANVYHDGDQAVPEPRECKPMAFVVKTRENNGVMRVEIARGCKYKCAFCALGHLKPYQEVSLAELRPLIKQAAGRRCSFFAPERTRHTEWPQIREALADAGCHDMGQDARLENLQEVDGASVTFGLEGLSTRLRKSIGKPFDDDMVMDRLGKFVESRKNVARVSVYFIAGLPGEAEEDWEAVWRLFERIGKAEWSRRLVLCPILNPLSPKKFTRLVDAHIDLFADFGTRWRKLLRRDGGQWGFRVIETLVWGPLERTMDALVQRGGAPAYDVVRQLPDSVLRGKPPVLKREGIARRILVTCATVGITQGQIEGVGVSISDHG